jgi:glycosyltransferase involved in cell wall biosynthesis
MKILMIAPEPFLEPRGTPISIYERLMGLSTLGYSIDLVTYHLGQTVDIKQVRIFRTMNVPFIREINIGPSIPKIFLDLLLFLKTVQMLIMNRYDLLHTHEEAAYFSVILSKLFNIPHIYDMHSSLPKQLKISKYRKCKILIYLFQWLEKIVLLNSNAIIAIASELQDHIRYINPRANITIIENLALPDLYSSDTQPSRAELITSLNLEGKIPIVYTGNFEAYQGMDLLIASAKILQTENKDAVFILVGGRPQQIQELTAKVKALGLQDRFLFTGRVTPDQIGKYLDIAHILVSPRSEGLPVPLKIYSYLYTGKPVLATNISAHKGFSEYENLILADHNAEAFARGLVQSIELSKHMPPAGFEAQKKQIAQEKLKLYLSLIERAYLSFSKPGKPIPSTEIEQR